MKKPFRIQLTGVSSLLALGFLAATSTPAHALTWFDGGTGVWDNSTANWNGGANTWTNNATASFNGAGSPVTIGASLQIGEITFGGAAGTYTFDNSGGYQMDFNGAGISTAPTSAVQLFTSTGTINFNNNASSGTSKITIDSMGEVHFTGSSTAGTSNLSNQGQLFFEGTSSANSSVISNLAGQIFFTGTASGGSAAITNGGSIDISGSSSPMVTLSMVTNSADIGGGTIINGGISVGLNKLELANGLSLDTSTSILGSNNSLSYTVDTTSTSGTIVLTGGLLTGSGTGRTEITLDGIGTPGPNNVPFVLIDWTAPGASFAANGVELSDFVFGPGGDPASHGLAGYHLAILNDKQLVLVPEPATFAMPLAAILGLVTLRRKASRRTA